jgi:hypothetical protein
MKKPILIHGCWALAVVAAFLAGRPGAGWNAGSGPDGDAATANGGLRASRVAGDAAAGNRPGRGGNRTSEARAQSQLTRLFGSIVSSDHLDLLAEQALRDPNPLTRRLAFSRLLEAMTPENAQQIREQLVALGADDDQWRDFHYGWGAIDGKAAFDHAANSPERDLAASISGWAAADPAAAIAMLDSLPEGMRGQRDELTAGVVAGLAHRDPALATELVLRLESESYGRAGNLMELVARETLRSQGPEAAAEWASQLPDGPLKGAAMGRIAEAYVRADPAAAAGWAERFAGQEFASRAIEQVGSRWARQDPVTAVGWLETLPESTGQKAGLRNAFGDWEDSDPVAAGQYLLAMPKGTQRDAAISGFATGYAWQNPQLAIQWAQDIEEPELRQSSLARAGQAFFRTNPEAAQAWLQTSGLPAETRQQILNPTNRR